MEKFAHRGVKTLLGDPRKAIIKLSGPMVIALLVQSLYNLADAIWVAGLGANALSAIGMFFPIFMIIIALASGVGLGGSSAISRKIGAHDRDSATQASLHTYVIGFIFIVIVVALIYPYLREIFVLMKAKGKTLSYVLSYSRILVLGSFFLVFNNISNGILRGEGDVKRAMYAMLLGTLLNIVLDPVFIYTFKLGVSGAAWATLFSTIVTSSLMFYWVFIKRDTYVEVVFKLFRYSSTLTWEILRVGLPSSFAQLSMALTMFFLNVIVSRAGGTDGIAVFTSAWRIVLVGIIPLLGIAIGVTAVTASAFGARDFGKLKTGYYFGVKIGFISELFVLLLVEVFAYYIAYIFSYAKGSGYIHHDLVVALRMLILFVPFTPLGMLTSSMFQGIGKGENALAVTILRTLIFQLGFAYLFGIVLKKGLPGVWAGIGAGNILASIIGFSWGWLEVRKLKRTLSSNP